MTSNVKLPTAKNQGAFYFFGMKPLERIGTVLEGIFRFGTIFA
jgi:hypothetical protein